jgi:hypothetical protein
MIKFDFTLPQIKIFLSMALNLFLNAIWPAISLIQNSLRVLDIIEKFDCLKIHVKGRKYLLSSENKRVGIYF